MSLSVKHSADNHGKPKSGVNTFIVGVSDRFYAFGRVVKGFNCSSFFEPEQIRSHYLWNIICVGTRTTEFCLVQGFNRCKMEETDISVLAERLRRTLQVRVRKSVRSIPTALFYSISDFKSPCFRLRLLGDRCHLRRAESTFGMCGLAQCTGRRSIKHQAKHRHSRGHLRHGKRPVLQLAR
jgi:hypothetical protein